MSQQVLDQWLFKKSQYMYDSGTDLPFVLRTIHRK